MNFFFDRNMGRSIPKAFRMLGLPVTYHDQLFHEKTRDDEWLAHVGNEGWIVVSHDTRFLQNESEKRALIDHNVGCFILVGGGLTKWAKAKILVRAWPRIERAVRSEPPPFVYKIYLNGVLRRVDVAKGS